MATTITIQPGQPGQGMRYNVRQPLPYPFHIDADTGDCVRGRGTAELGDDPTGTTPWRLLGFQTGAVQELTLTFRQWLSDPEAGRGLFPVFIDWRGSIFHLTEPITDVKVNADPQRVVS
ncbi:hypothetical protein [Cellulomonas sp. RIT-PI-Y]|uniref:hypothetical protein n=1 Tax=Cellulomonas sp. RIT-PI-Y TaxID=3035297 RepID=UPI0021D98D1E|nr:hypothetical protein [Cellulomonas sp. RIT-PI-Y]